jgi:hypothetical protein
VKRWFISHLESLANKKISRDRAFDSLLLAFYAYLQKALGSQFLVCFALTLFFLFFSFKLPRETFYGEGMLANLRANTMIIIARAGQT